VTKAPRICESCAMPMRRRPRENASQWRERRYCSRACFFAALAERAPSEAELEIIYANYAIDPETGCWIWGGHVDRNGYGRVYDPSRPKGKRSEWAHRAFYRRHKGPIPERHEVDHECQNTVCVNPEHLAAVTKVEHARRTFARLGKDDLHRFAAELRTLGLTYGEIAEVLEYSHSGSAAAAVLSAIRKGLVEASSIPEQRRLTQSEREDIRELYAFGVPQTELAAWYGTDSSHISRICNRLDGRAARREAGQSA